MAIFCDKTHTFLLLPPPANAHNFKDTYFELFYSYKMAPFSDKWRNVTVHGHTIVHRSPPPVCHPIMRMKVQRDKGIEYLLR